jgi:hypothetical protein
MIRILVPVVIAVGGIASGVILGNRQLKNKQPLVAMFLYSEGIFSVALALYLYLKVLA